MSIYIKQSSIGEVRDQLSLDYADGKYLNRVSANLGIQRPPFGFSDATWRAVVKAIALQHKQIRTKFEEILSIILGPKVTQCTALLEDAIVGDTSAVLVNTDHLPQVGTMVLDEGLGSEETVNYVYIDRYTNRVYFETPLVNNHTAVGVAWETGVISPVSVSASSMSVFDATGFPNSGTFTVCVGRGTEYEQAGPLVSSDFMSRKLDTGFAMNLGASSIDAVAGKVVNLAPVASQENTYYLTLEDVSALPIEGGYLQAELDKTFTATSGSTNFVTVSSPLTEDVYGGYWVRFTGNVTSALTNVLGYVNSNSNTSLFFANTLPAVPVAGDEFVVLANFQYIRTSPEDNTVLMKKEFPDLLTLAPSSELHVIRPTVTVSVAQVQVKGAGWDVFQVDPRHVEILLPTKFLSNDLRSASYIRDTGQSGTVTTNAPSAFGMESISVVDTAGFPLIGVLTHDSTSTQYSYYVPHCWATVQASAGDTSLIVTDTSQFPTTGTLSVNGSSVLYTVVDQVTLSTGALPVDIQPGDLITETHIIRLTKPLENGVGSGDTLTFYVNYDSGDIWNVDDVWPGPYVWDLFAEIHEKETVPGNTLTSYVSGPTILSVDRNLTATVLEVDDASCFPVAVPFNVRVGENSGNLETLSVQELSLKSRTHTTVAADVLVGDSEIEVVALNGPTPPLNTFPNGGPYRVVLEPFTASQEVVEVIGTAVGPSRLLLAAPTTQSHLTGSAVVLLSDLLRISPATADEHIGKISETDKLKLYAPETQTKIADLVRPLYTSITLSLAGTDFPENTGNAVFNFGCSVCKAKTKLVGITGSVLSLEDTSQFPTTGYPYVITVDVGAGPLKEEKLHVTLNDTLTNELTVSHPPIFTHDAGRVVEFNPGPQENISYTNRVGSVLSFSTYLEIEHTHQAAEFLAPTVGTGYPRDNGYDFQLRLPVSIEDRIRYVVDLVRAAGIEVTFIDKR